jgi:hypothetical protein
VVTNPEAAILQSDNLDALLALHASLMSESERSSLVAALLDRLDEKKGYLRVSYFIVCTLWRLGYLWGYILKTLGRKYPHGTESQFCTHFGQQQPAIHSKQQKKEYGKHMI